MEQDLVPNERDVLGEVEVDGVIYQLRRAGLSERQIVRRNDRRIVGRLRGSPSSMWLLEAEDIDEELLHSIVHIAIEEGLLVDLPTD